MQNITTITAPDTLEANLMKIKALNGMSHFFSQVRAKFMGSPPSDATIRRWIRAGTTNERIKAMKEAAEEVLRP